MLFKNNLTILKVNKKYKFYLTDYNQTTVKTYLSESVDQYKNLKIYYLDKFELFLKCNSDMSISDSMMYNASLDFSFGSSYLNCISYYKYLGLIKNEFDEKKINIRSRFPDSQRATGKKTIYYINENLKQDYKLIKEDNLDEQYKISFNGKTFSYSRV